MAETPIIARFGNVQGTSLELPGFRSRTLSQLTDHSFVRFEGDSAPRGFRGGAYYKRWAVTAQFWRTQYQEARDLIKLFEDSAAAFDKRLYFDHGGRLGDLIPFSFAVEVPDWEIGFDKVAGIATVTFTATEVSSGQNNVTGSPVFKNQLQPVITGSLKIYDSLTASKGTWNMVDGVSFTYQWRRDNVDIPGATSSAYQLQFADSDKQITVKVTGSVATSSPASSISDPVSVDMFDFASTLLRSAVRHYDFGNFVNEGQRSVPDEAGNEPLQLGDVGFPTEIREEGLFLTGVNHDVSSAGHSEPAPTVVKLSFAGTYHNRSQNAILVGSDAGKIDFRISTSGALVCYVFLNSTQQYVGQQTQASHGLVEGDFFESSVEYNSASGLTTFTTSKLGGVPKVNTFSNVAYAGHTMFDVVEWFVGSRSSSQLNYQCTCKSAKVEFDGVVIVAPDFEVQEVGAQNFKDSVGETWTVNSPKVSQAPTIDVYRGRAGVKFEGGAQGLNIGIADSPETTKWTVRCDASMSDLEPSGARLIFSKDNLSFRAVQGAQVVYYDTAGTYNYSPNLPIEDLGIIKDRPFQLRFDVDTTTGSITVWKRDSSPSLNLTSDADWGAPVRSWTGLSNFDLPRRATTDNSYNMGGNTLPFKGTAYRVYLMDTENNHLFTDVFFERDNPQGAAVWVNAVTGEAASLQTSTANLKTRFVTHGSTVYDGNDDHSKLVYVPVFQKNSGGFTFYWDGFISPEAGNYSVLGSDETSTNRGSHIYINGSGTLKIYIWDINGVNSNVSTGINFRDGVRSKVVGVWDGDNQELRIATSRGTYGQVAINQALSTIPHQGWNFMRRGPGTYRMKGQIYDTALWDRALNQTEMEALVNA